MRHGFEAKWTFLTVGEFRRGEVKKLGIGSWGIGEGVGSFEPGTKMNLALEAMRGYWGEERRGAKRRAW